MLTQEKAAIKIQAGVRGLLTRRHVQRTVQQELEFIGMKPKVCFYPALLAVPSCNLCTVHNGFCLLTTTKLLPKPYVCQLAA